MLYPETLTVSHRGFVRLLHLLQNSMVEVFAVNWPAAIVLRSASFSSVAPTEVGRLELEARSHIGDLQWN